MTPSSALRHKKSGTASGARRTIHMTAASSSCSANEWEAACISRAAFRVRAPWLSSPTGMGRTSACRSRTGAGRHSSLSPTPRSRQRPGPNVPIADRLCVRIVREPEYSMPAATVHDETPVRPCETAFERERAHLRNPQAHLTLRRPRIAERERHARAVRLVADVEQLVALRHGTWIAIGVRAQLDAHALAEMLLRENQQQS